MAKLPTVIIIGRINVGKSALFNCLTESGKALVSEIPGTTRDYNTAKVNWRTKTFSLIDTGGVNIDTLKDSIQAILSTKKKEKKLLRINSIEKEILQQTKKALAKADLILMVVDGQAGILPEDKELALILKKLNKIIFLVCNKIDNPKYRYQTNEFFKLGLGKPFAVSSINGSGTGDLLDEVIKKIKGQKGRPKKETGQKPVKVAVVGKPNVGKSSLVNKILGETRVIVSPIAQTTREPQDTEITYKNQKIILIDTAGLRKKAKIQPGLEKITTKKTLGTINHADVVLFITEVNEPLGKQDSYLGGLIKDSGCGIIIVTNKWDLIIDKTEKIDHKIVTDYQSHFPYLTFAPIIFISAKTGKNVEKILDLVLELDTERNKKISAEKLNEILKKMVKQHYPAQANGLKRPKLYSLTQTRIKPPEFTVMIGQGQSLHFSYLRFIENQIRQNFGFIGVPVRIKVNQASK